jgi:hypothetical protein
MAPGVRGYIIAGNLKHLFTDEPPSINININAASCPHSAGIVTQYDVHDFYFNQ